MCENSEKAREAKVICSDDIQKLLLIKIHVNYLRFKKPELPICLIFKGILGIENSMQIYGTMFQGTYMGMPLIPLISSLK